MHKSLKYSWLVLFAAPLLISATDATTTEQRQTVLSVSGVGYSTSLGAEVFTISAGAKAFSRYPGRAIRDNAQVLERLREQLADKGIDRRDVSTTNFQFQRTRDPEDNDGDRDWGYQTSQQLVVFVRNTDQAGAVIEALVEAGADDVSVQNRRSWGSDRPSPEVEAAARKQAVLDARKKASDYAAALDMRISRIVSITDGGARITGEPPSAAARLSVAPTQIDNGQSAVVASVNMQFELARRR